jgi:hypothetical protein
MKIELMSVLSRNDTRDRENTMDVFTNSIEKVPAPIPADRLMAVLAKMSMPLQRQPCTHIHKKSKASLGPPVLKIHLNQQLLTLNAIKWYSRSLNL